MGLSIFSLWLRGTLAKRLAWNVSDVILFHEYAETHGKHARPWDRQVELSPLPRWLDRETWGRQRACA